MYQTRHSFYWCERRECPDNVRFNEAGVLLDHDNRDPSFAPSCVVDLFMLKLVSCVLAHVFELRSLVDSDDYDYGLDNITCERFLGVGWQAIFLQKFCTTVTRVGNDVENLISFNSDDAVPPHAQQYVQAYPSNVHLVDNVHDLDLTQVLPVGTDFTLHDLSHTMSANLAAVLEEN